MTKHAYMLGVYDPHSKTFSLRKWKFSCKLGAKKILAAKYYALGGKNFPAKKLNIIILKR